MSYYTDKMPEYQLLFRNTKDLLDIETESNPDDNVRNLFTVGTDDERMSSKEIMNILKRNNVVITASKTKLILEKLGAIHTMYREEGKVIKGYRRIKIIQ